MEQGKSNTLLYEDTVTSLMGRKTKDLIKKRKSFNLLLNYIFTY